MEEATGNTQESLTFADMGDAAVIAIARQEYQAYASSPPGGVKRAAWDAFQLTLRELYTRGIASPMSALTRGAPPR